MEGLEKLQKYSVRWSSKFKETNEVTASYSTGDFNMYIGDTVLNNYFEFNLLIIALCIQKKKNA